MSMEELWNPCVFLNYCYSRWFNICFIYLRLNKSRQHLMGFFKYSGPWLQGRAQRGWKGRSALPSEIALWGELSPQEQITKGKSNTKQSNNKKEKRSRGLDHTLNRTDTHVRLMCDPQQVYFWSVGGDLGLKWLGANTTFMFKHLGVYFINLFSWKQKNLWSIPTRVLESQINLMSSPATSIVFLFLK